MMIDLLRAELTTTYESRFTNDAKQGKPITKTDTVVAYKEATSWTNNGLHNEVLLFYVIHVPIWHLSILRSKSLS